MHDIFVEALLKIEPLRSALYRGVDDSTGNAIHELEALVARADGRVN
ncbi:MAG: hypothetical protein ABW318_14150 [Vicinamibacterales bacterium]